MSDKSSAASSWAAAGRAFVARASLVPALGLRAQRQLSVPPRVADRSERSGGKERPGGAQADITGARAARRKNDLVLVVSAGLAAVLVASSLILLAGIRIRQLQTGYHVHDLRSELVKLRHERAALEVERSALLRTSRLAELARASLDLVPVDAARSLRVGNEP